MKRLLLLSGLVLALLLPALAQWRGRQLSADDQRLFDSYFSRYQEYQRTNNRDEVRSMEKRMQDISPHTNIPTGTPSGLVARRGKGGGWHGGRDRDRDWSRERDRDRDWDRDRRPDWDRYRDRDRDYYRQNRQLSSEDQGRFDSYYQRWLNYRRTNNRDEVVSMEKRMYDVYDHYGIPRDVPFDRVASRGGRY